MAVSGGALATAMAYHAFQYSQEWSALTNYAVLALALLQVCSSGGGG